MLTARLRLSRNTRRRRQRRKTRGTSAREIEISRISMRRRPRYTILLNENTTYAREYLCSSETRDRPIFERPEKPLFAELAFFLRRARTRYGDRGPGSLVAIRCHSYLCRELTSFNYTCAHFCICTRWTGRGSRVLRGAATGARRSSAIRLSNRERENRACFSRGPFAHESPRRISS